MSLALKNVIQVEMEIGNSKIKAGTDQLAAGFTVFKSEFARIGANSLVIDFKRPTYALAHKMREYIINREWKMEDDLVDAKRDREKARLDYMNFQNNSEEPPTPFLEGQQHWSGTYQAKAPDDIEENLDRTSDQVFVSEYNLNALKARMDKIHANMGVLLISQSKTSQGFLNVYEIGVHYMLLDDENLIDGEIIDSIEIAAVDLGSATVKNFQFTVFKQFEKLWNGDS